MSQFGYGTMWAGRMRLKCDGIRAETRFRLSAKRTSPYKSAGSSVKWTTGSRGVRISGSNAGCTMFRGTEKGTGYPLHSPVSPSLPQPCVTVWHHISTGLYQRCGRMHWKWRQRVPLKRSSPDDYQTKRRHSPHTKSRNPDTAITDLALINTKINTEIKSNYTTCMQKFEPWT